MKKYYWLKLKEDFFEEKQIKYLRSLPDGDKLVIAYLKMQLKSLKTEGFIKYDNVLPSNLEELSMILDENVNTVTLMVKELQQVKAVEILDDGSFYMLAMQDLVGKEGESTERVRKFRERQKEKELKALHCNANETLCNTEIDIEKDIDIDIEKEKKERFKKPTLEEIEKYVKEKQLKVNAKSFFDYFEAGDWKDSKGNKVKSWKQKLLTWEKFNNFKEDKQRPSTERKGINFNQFYSNM